MTTRAAATQAQIKRAISAALQCGLAVKAIRPDGTVEVIEVAEDESNKQDGQEERPWGL